MRIILTENQIQKCVLCEFAQQLASNDYNPIADGNAIHNPYSKQIKESNKLLASFLANNGKIMTNIDNGKDYLVYEIMALANLIGKRFGLCQLIKDNEPFGAIYTKPLNLFRTKIR